MTKSFAVIGGDERQKAMAESLSNDGYTVYATGFEKTNLPETINKASEEECILNSNYVILPLPFTLDYKTINAPLADKSILLNENFAKLLVGKKVFCGLKSRFDELGSIWKGLDIEDYATREDFAVKNAVPTSEGAVAFAINQYKGTIHGSRCLVAGFGRIGKVLSRILSSMGADVTVSARNRNDKEWIKVSGFKAADSRNLAKENEFDLIFNTVPYLIFDENTLAKIASKSIVIDLASKPGGVDFDAAKRMKLKTFHVLALPGKCAPYAAGKIIKTTIYNMLEEGAQ